MSSSLNGLVRAFAQRFLDPIPYDEDYCEQVNALSAEGDVVYVHRARNVISHLALSRVVQGLGLPKARFVGGLNVRWLRKWFGLFSPRRAPRSSQKTKANVKNGCCKSVSKTVLPPSSFYGALLRLCREKRTLKPNMLKPWWRYNGSVRNPFSGAPLLGFAFTPFIHGA